MAISRREYFKRIKEREKQREERIKKGTEKPIPRAVEIKQPERDSKGRSRVDRVKQGLSADIPEEKSVIVMQRSKDETGAVHHENVSDYLTEQQRREVSRLTSERGRLDVKDKSRTETVNEKGETVITRGITFGYDKKVPEQKVLMSEPTKEVEEKKVSGKEETVYSRAEPRKGISGAMDWLETKEREALEKQRVREYEGKGTFENMAVLPALAVAKVGVGFVKLGKDFIMGTAEKTKEVAPLVAKDPSLLITAPYEKAKETTKFIADDPSLLITAPMGFAEGLGRKFKENPLGTATEFFAGYGVVKGASLGIKAVSKIAKAPKIVGETRGATISTKTDGVTRSASRTQTNIKSGRTDYKVDAVTKTVDRADDVNVRIQSSSTDLNIVKLDRTGNIVRTNTGFARGETLLTKTKDGTILARGNTVQATNIGKSSIIKQGDVVSTGKTTTDSYALTNIVKTGRGKKTAPISSADDLKLIADKSKKVTSIETTGAKKIAEFEAPLTRTIDTSAGRIQITDQGKKVTQTLYDDFGSARAGRYLSKSDKATNIKIDPYTQTIKDGSFSISSKPTETSFIFKKPETTIVSSTPSSGGVNIGSASSQATKTTQISAQKPIVPTSSQSLTAVQDVVNTKINVRVDQVARPTSAVVTGGVAISSAKTDQEAVVQSPKQQSTETAQKPILQSTKTTQKPILSTVRSFKTFTSSKTIPKEKVDLSAVSGIKTITGGRTSTKQKTFTDSVVKEKTETEQSIITSPAQTTTPLPKIKTMQTVRPIPPRPVLLMIPSPSRSPTPRTLSQGFGVWVREKGVFKQVGRGAFSRQDAKDYGAFVVSNTPRATFMLKPSASHIRVAPSKSRGWFGRTSSNFKIKGGMFIEKKEKRITTKGELAGITRKGILASKQKNIFKGLKL